MYEIVMFHYKHWGDLETQLNEVKAMGKILITAVGVPKEFGKEMENKALAFIFLTDAH